MLEIPGYPRLLSRLDGAYAFAEDGRRFTDYHMSLGASVLGHCHRAVNDAAKAQIDLGPSFPSLHASEELLAGDLCEVIPSCEMVVFAKNGCDVTNLAVKLARHVTGRDHAISIGYHGWGDWAIHGTNPAGIPAATRALSETIAIGGRACADAEAAIERIGPRLAVVVAELNAYDAFPPEALVKLAAMTRRVGALFVLDEIVTGFRMALGGAAERFSIDADMVCVGKAMGNGFPIAALCGKRALMKRIEEVFYSLTFATEPVAMAAARATIAALRKADYGHVWRLGAMLRDGLGRALARHGVPARVEGRGPYARFVPEPKQEGALVAFLGHLARHGSLFSHTNPILPSFAHTEGDVRATVEAAEAYEAA